MEQNSPASAAPKNKNPKVILAFGVVALVIGVIVSSNFGVFTKETAFFALLGLAGLTFLLN